MNDNPMRDVIEQMKDAAQREGKMQTTLPGVHFENGYLTQNYHAEDAITDEYKPYRSDEYAFPVVYTNRAYRVCVEWHKTQEAADARKVQIAGFGMWIEEYPEQGE